MSVASNIVTVTVEQLVPSKINISVAYGSIVYGQSDTITGTVYDQNGNPLGGVTLYLWVSNFNTDEKWAYTGLSTTSASDGTFSFTITSKYYSVGRNLYQVTTYSGTSMP
ncbi:MAG: hypothetical protein RXR31_01715 [Thermoproteota archaeon]